MSWSPSVYHPVYRGGVFERLDGEYCLAATADLSVVPLQKRLSLVGHAVRTNEMLWFSHVMAFFQPIHEAAGRSIPKFIAVEVRLLCLRCRKRSGKHRQPLYQRGVRDLDASHLCQQFASGEFDFRSWDLFHRFRQLFDFDEGFSCPLRRRASVFREFNRVSDGLEFDIHSLPQVDSFPNATSKGSFAT